MELEDGNAQKTELQCADLRKATVYGTEFREAEISFTDLRDLRLPLDEWEGLISVFSEIEELEARLEEKGEHCSQDGRERVEEAIDYFWSIAFDLPLNPTVISPIQGFDVMHDQQGLFATWPAPPGVTEFEQARADYRAKLAYRDRYIAESMRWQAKAEANVEDNPALAKALRAKAESGDCSVLAEVLEETSEFEQARADYRAKLACTDRYIAEGMWQRALFDPALAKALGTKAESGECPELAEVLKEDQ